MGCGELAKPALYFDDIYVGQEFPPLHFELTKEKVNNYIEAVVDPNPIYKRGIITRDGNCVYSVPPTIAALFVQQSYKHSYTKIRSGYKRVKTEAFSLSQDERESIGGNGQAQVPASPRGFAGGLRQENSFRKADGGLPLGYPHDDVSLPARGSGLASFAP